MFVFLDHHQIVLLVTFTSTLLGEAKLESLSNHEVLLVPALVQTCYQCTYLCIQTV